MRARHRFCNLGLLSSRLETRKVEVLTLPTGTQEVTRGPDRDQAEISQVTSPQSQTVNSPESNAGPPAPKESTETLTQSPTRSWEDASEQDIVPGPITRRFEDSAHPIQQNPQFSPHPAVVPTFTDSAGKVKGMYRLLDLIEESGSNGYVHKVIISLDSLQHFINAVSPGAYTPDTKVDFKALDQFLIKPLGVYGSKDAIVRLLRSIDVVDENTATSLLSPSDVSNSRPTLSSGLYIVKANATDRADERHRVIYWPEDTTWCDSATSSVRRNRTTFMRYLTKICDQVVSLLSREQSASIVWNDEQSISESADIDEGNDSDRLFIFEVAEKDKQEENAVARPGFQVTSRYISASETRRDCPVDPALLAPRLVSGETTQGFFTATHVSQKTRPESLQGYTFTLVALKQLLLNSGALVLSETLDEKAVQILVGIAIAERFPEQCDKWCTKSHGARTMFTQELTERKEIIRKGIIRGLDSLRGLLCEAVVDDVLKLFPSLERDRLSQASRPQAGGVSNTNRTAEATLRPSDLESLYPGFQSVYHRHIQNARFSVALRRDPYFKKRKQRMVAVKHLLDKHKNLPTENRSVFIQTLLKGDFNRAQNLLSKIDGKNVSDSGGWGSHRLFAGGGDILKRNMGRLAGNVSDAQFLLDLNGISDTDTRATIQEIVSFAHAQLATVIDATVKGITRDVLDMQVESCTRSMQHEMESEGRKSQKSALAEFIRDINAHSSGRRDSVLYVDGVTATRDPPGRYGDGEAESGTRFSSDYGQEYMVTGRLEVLQGPGVEYSVFPIMVLQRDDKHSMQLDSKYIPQAIVNNRLGSAFHVPIGMNTAFCQLLDGEKLLLILVDQVRVTIYLERLTTMDMAIQRRRPVKVLSREKLERDILFTFDEKTRRLAVCAPTKLHLHSFVFDETFKTLQGQGSGINLFPWYSQAGETSIEHIAFVCGTEEVVFIDSNARARIFSFVSKQFRPASLQLPSPPSAIFSSPDGSCLFTLHTRDKQPSLTAYHWATFGTTGGIALDFPDFPLQGAVLTSLVSREHVFLLGLDVDAGSIKSIAIDITKKHTESGVH